MKKIGRIYREKLIQAIRSDSEDANAVFFVNFRTLTATQLNKLRATLKGKQAVLLVAKNSLIRKALSESDSGLNDFLKTETGIVYSYGDLVDTAKALFEFNKEFEKLEIKGGFIKQQLFKAKELENISRLPSRNVLLGMTLNCIASPLTSFVTGLNYILLQFIWVIEEIKKKKEQE